jgi:hypothetical protein
MPLVRLVDRNPKFSCRNRLSDPSQNFVTSLIFFGGPSKPQLRLVKTGNTDRLDRPCSGSSMRKLRSSLASRRRSGCRTR